MTSLAIAKEKYDIIDGRKPPSNLAIKTKTILQKVSSYLGLFGDSEDNDDDDQDSGDVPTVFCYSLFYVYYDQYTYITGVLAQNILLGMIAIFFSVQILSSI